LINIQIKLIKINTYLENKIFKWNFKSGLLGPYLDANLYNKIYLTRHTHTTYLQDKFGNHQNFFIEQSLPIWRRQNFWCCVVDFATRRSCKIEGKIKQSIIYKHSMTSKHRLCRTTLSANINHTIAKLCII